MIKIRELNPEDVEQASYLIRRALIQVNSRDYSREIITNLVNLFTPQNLIKMALAHTILVAVKNKSIVGTVRLKENAIFTVFVDPDYHHQGIGRTLLHAVETLAKKRGYNEVELGASITAFNFYKKIGYMDTGDTYEDEYGLTYIMKKKLNKIDDMKNE